MKQKLNIVDLLKNFERVVILALAILMSFIILLSTIDLTIAISKNILKNSFLIEPTDLLSLFGLFLFVLIGIELLNTIKAYIMENEIHVQVVLMAALIAVARKVIVLDIRELSPLTLFGLGFIIIALSAGIYIVKISHQYSSEVCNKILRNGNKKN